MFTLATTVPDCSLILSARLAGGVVLGLAIVALEAWLRVPVRPVLDGQLQQAQARVLAFLRNLSF